MGHFDRGTRKTYLQFCDSEKLGGIPNGIFPLGIKSTISNFDVFWVIINGRRSYDIVYSDLFENLGLEREKLWPYEGSGLQYFNVIVTFPYGYFKLMVIMEDGKDTRMFESYFLMVPYKSVYNCILGIPLTAALDAIAFLIHLKLQYLNVHNELVIIRDKLSKL